MQNVMVYFQCKRCVEVQSEDVYLKDLGSLCCADKITAAKLRSIKVKHFGKEEAKRCVISCVRLIELMQEACPDIQVDCLGETDVLVEWVKVEKHKSPKMWWKSAFVCLVSFFGTAFTIMAYHNDIGINEVFTEVYCQVMNAQPQGLNPLEISYCVGLAAGIIVFYNHVGGRRLTKDPTPIEVAMYNYEYDVDMTLMELADREGLEEDVK